MRGKGLPGPVMRITGGITPAYAGKSPPPDNAPRLAGDHPRVCGEKGLLKDIAKQLQGSPPRMRGKVAFTALNVTTDGITPAYAGKSPLSMHWW